MRPAEHCFIYHSIYVNVSYMNNEISAKSGKSMESDPIDFDPIDFKGGLSIKAGAADSVKKQNGYNQASMRLAD